MLKQYQFNVISRLRNHCCDITGKRILEIGGDLEHKVAKYFIQEGASHVVDINKHPSAKTRDIDQHISVISGDCTRLTDYFKHNYFDIAFGVGVLEHINGIPAMLEQLFSVVNNNGFVCMQGGPIWTGPQGHHVWCVRDNQNQFIYKFNNDTNPIPDWYHLLTDFDGMIDYLTAKREIPHEHALEIAEWIYKSDELSRLGYRDLVKVFKSNKFKTVGFYVDSVKLNKKILKKLERKHEGSILSILEVIKGKDFRLAKKMIRQKRVVMSDFEVTALTFVLKKS